jgi:protein-disulfide isomerase
LLILALLGALTGCAQAPSDELARLRKDLDAVRETQKQIIKELEDIKKFLRSLGQPQAPQEAVLNLTDAPFRGQKNAKLTLVEFSDYQCPFCARHVVQTLPQIVNDYVNTGKLKYFRRDFPLESIHPVAAKAAEAAHCAGEQGKYWEMHDRLVANVRSLNAKTMPEHAQALGLDGARFQQCYDSGKYAARVRSDMSEGMKAGVSGTPMFFLGLTTDNLASWKATKSLMGAVPYSEFKEALDGLLAGK